MSAEELDPKIQPIDPTGHKPLSLRRQSKMDRFSQARRGPDQPVISTPGPVQGTHGAVCRRPQVEISAHRPAFRIQPLSMARGMAAECFLLQREFNTWERACPSREKHSIPAVGQCLGVLINVFSAVDQASRQNLEPPFTSSSPPAGWDSERKKEWPKTAIYGKGGARRLPSQFVPKRIAASVLKYCQSTVATGRSC
jgi:hypothetical protein